MAAWSGPGLGLGLGRGRGLRLGLGLAFGLGLGLGVRVSPTVASRAACSTRTPTGCWASRKRMFRRLAFSLPSILMRDAP